MKAVYLGPPGTFTHQAVKHMCPQAEYEPAASIEAVFEAVLLEKCMAVLPIENSTEGAVNQTLDGLLRWKPLITAAHIMPIKHTLMGSSYAITEIMAHPQAIAQCRQYLRKHYPEAILTNCASTAEAAFLVKQGQAAIGTEEAAEEYGLKILDRGIQDEDCNSTIFIRLEAADTVDLSAFDKIIKSEMKNKVKSNLRTSIAFSTDNKPGALYRMLGLFENMNINMVKILSRPVPKRPGEYIFFVDLEDCVDEALEQVKVEALEYWYFGTYEMI